MIPRVCPTDVYAVIDLYGQCAQVSVMNHVTRLQDNSLLCSDSQILESSQALSILLGKEMAHRSVQIEYSALAGTGVGDAGIWGGDKIGSWRETIV